MAKVALERISKRYGATPAVTDVDLAIADEEFVVLVGPSGCGKSTTLRLVEQKHRRIAHNRPANRDALALAAR